MSSAQKNSEYEKKLKTEHKKLSLSEGRAYKFLQKFGEKKPDLRIPKIQDLALEYSTQRFIFVISSDVVVEA